MFFICQLPIIAKGIGKNQFKRYLELFIDTIFYSLVRFISSFILLLLLLFYYWAACAAQLQIGFSVVGTEKLPLGEGRHEGLVPRNDVTVYYAKQAVFNF